MDANRHIRQISEAAIAQYADALAWRSSVSVPVTVVWLPDGWATQPAQDAWTAGLLPQHLQRRLRAARKDGERGRLLRAARAANERCAMQAAMQEVFRCSGVQAFGTPPNTEHRTLNTFYLSRTSLGQPVIRWRGAAAAWARENGLAARHLHISFSHDGTAHLCLAAYAPGLRGLGVDVVHLPRLRRSDRNGDYLRRFARHFMSAEEWTAFLIASAHDDPETLVRRTAAHFSLMESASKALGTGLKIGAGLGHAASLPKQSLNITALSPSVEFHLGPEAQARCAAISANRWEGHWGADGEYLVSAVLLWE